MSCQSEIERLLEETNFKVVVWDGATMMWGDRNAMDWDCTFIDTDGEEWVKREFVCGSVTRVKLEEIVTLFRKMKVPKGTIIYI